VLDIFSRYVVAWTVQACEDSQIAKTMLEEAFGLHGIPDAVHADRGTSMTSKPVAQLLLDLGVDRSHSRPRVSNDNPYSESAFKTLKYAPVFPDAFGSLADARTFCEAFFTYYNHEHRHSGIGLHTPASVHFGTAAEIRAQRQATLDAAHATPPAPIRQPPTPGTQTAPGRLDQPTLTGGPHTDRVTTRVSDCLTSSDLASHRAVTQLGLLVLRHVVNLSTGYDNALHNGFPSGCGVRAQIGGSGDANSLVA
jgi:hypothetical protein